MKQVSLRPEAHRSCTVVASFFLLALFSLTSPAARATLPATDELPRVHQTLTTDWRTLQPTVGVMPSSEIAFISRTFDDSMWNVVEVPHNWDTYGGYRQTKHGQLHGTAWYRRWFTLDDETLAAIDRDERRVFLLFEGVGSYATVWVNGRQVGRHAGGLTTFTVDVTDALGHQPGQPNLLAVRAEHPAGIRDLPWVCGGCERAYGFSEGSQPFGIFRPVHVVVTNSLRIAPFGVHVWNDKAISPESATAQIQTEITNHAATLRTFTLRTSLLSPDGRCINTTESPLKTLAPGATVILGQQQLTAAPALLWSLDHPTLYTIRSELRSTTEANATASVIDRVDTTYGFRWIDWPRGNDRARGTFLLNGQPVFLNGTCEYPHLLGGGHAFGAAQIDSRVRQIEAAGFNAFRDAHHPHDLRYNQHWDRDGLAWWPQFGAHIWFDRDDFRANFLALLRDWVKERRNSPSLVLWGLQNESQLPAAFAAECTALIRELDPTTSDQRLVTTCNGGSGTDWDVPQNWTGTYGGDPLTYSDDLRREVLVGEYGAWRSADLHSSNHDPSSSGYDEETFTGLLETKIRLAEAARSHSAGHFQWIFSTHENPGRTFGAKGEQLADGWPLLDRVGPANNKGLLTSWGEPLDAFYMYRANFAPAATQPMVVIAGSNWPDHILTQNDQPADSIIAYSNCDEVELFNGPISLGARTRRGLGAHFQWDGVQLHFRDLRAVARRAGKVVAQDAIELPHLPPIEPRRDDLRVVHSGQDVRGVPPPRISPAADSETASNSAPDTTAPEPGFNYLYRVNCGGAAYTDTHGQRWLADREFCEGDSWGATSWAHAYPHLSPSLASARRVFTPITGTRDSALYQTFRYGRSELRYTFALPDGDYRIELHFAEPWYGRGNCDATGWRLFDIAFNGTTVLHNFDLFREAGFAVALRKRVDVHVSGGRLEISFPRVSSYQAVISAIAIATRDANLPRPSPSTEIVAACDTVDASLEAWLDSGDRAFTDETDAASPMAERSVSLVDSSPDRSVVITTVANLPPAIQHQPWLRRAAKLTATPLSITLNGEADVYAVVPREVRPWPNWEATGETVDLVGPKTASFALLRRHYSAHQTAEIPQALFVAFVPIRPLAPPQAIRVVNVEGSSLPDAWRAAGNLQRGDRPYGANGPAFAQLPAELIDADWLRTPELAADPNLRIHLTATDHVEITIGLDAKVADVPGWLRDWQTVDQQSTLGSRILKLFRRRFESGTSITLGENGVFADGSAAPMYVVVARPVRPSSIYAAPVETLSLEKPVAVWTISVGVGDRYGLVLPYRKTTHGTSRVRYELLNESGAVLCTDEFDWNETESVARLRTCTSINAGTYRVRLSLIAGPSLRLSTLMVE